MSVNLGGGGGGKASNDSSYIAAETLSGVDWTASKQDSRLEPQASQGRQEAGGADDRDPFYQGQPSA